MKQFKELSIDEQLDLIKHVLEGNDLKYDTPARGEGVVYGDTEAFQICKTYAYTKQPTKLETLYKEQEAIQEKIDAELKRLGKPVTNDNTEVVQAPSEEEKTSENVSLERITLENWKDLGIKVGDKVKFEKVHDIDVGIDTYEITDLEPLTYDGTAFIELEEAQWWGYDSRDVVYLIRTQEGSLND